MDDRLLPRKVPEPTRFPSVIFEPCVPDASLVFGCGLFEAPKESTEVTKPPPESASTEYLSHHGIRETEVPSWIKAYGVEKKTGEVSFNFGQNDRRCISSEYGKKRADFEVSERKSAEKFSGRTDSGFNGAGSMCAGQKTDVSTCEVELVEYENSTAVREMEVRGEKCVKNAIGNFPEDTAVDSFSQRPRYDVEGSKVTSLQTRGEILDRHSTDCRESVTSVPQQCLADVARRTARPTRDLRDLPGDHRDGTASAASPTGEREIENVAELGSFPGGNTNRRAGATHYASLSDRIAQGTAKDTASLVSTPQVPRAVELQKKIDKFPEPQKGFISSDCSLSDCTPLDPGRRSAKWKKKLAKESDPGSVVYKNAGRATQERDPSTFGNCKKRGGPGSAKGKNAMGSYLADFGNVGARDSVSDPLIRALFHLQNRQTELLLQLSADVGEVALKQKRMFDVFQRLQSAFCDGGVCTAAEVPTVSGGDRKRRCDKCTQTNFDGDGRLPRSTADATTQSDSTGGVDGEGTLTESRPENGVTAEMEDGGSCRTLKDFGVAECAASEEAESGTCVARRSESRGVDMRAGTGTGREGEGVCGRAVSPDDVRRLVSAVRSVAARVEDSGGEMRRPSRETGTGAREVEEERGNRSREAEVADLVAAMRSVTSRSKKNDFIKAPNLEDVAEASEDSSDSEDDGASELCDKSLTIGDLSLVPQNVSSPDPSLRIDLRGLEISSDALASGSYGSETEESAHCSKEKEDYSKSSDTTAVYLYRNIFSKVQEILEHSKAASESRRESSEKKPVTYEAESGRTRTRSH